MFWSTVAPAFKLALRELNPLQLLFYASITSVTALFIILLCQRKIGLLLNLSVKEVFRSALLGFLNPFIYYLVLFKAYSILPAQEAQPLNWTWPIVLTLLSALVLKQKLSAASMAAILLSFTGVLVIAVKGDFAALHFTSLEGDALAVVSSLFWASYWILNLRDRRDPVLKLFLNFTFGVIYISALMMASGVLVFPTPFALGTAVYIGLFEMGVTFVIWLKALTIAESSAKIANLVYITPFLSLVFIHIILGETIHPSSIIGLTLIVGGILLQNLKKKPSFDRFSSSTIHP